MDQTPNSHSAVPTQTTSPEEDATLLAIEALEARSVDPDPRPLTTPLDMVVPPPQTVVAPPASPKVIEPVMTKPVVPKLAAPAMPAKPKKPTTPSEEMAEALASAPVSSNFQFFANQTPPRKSFIIVGIIVVIVGAAVAAYFALR